MYTTNSLSIIGTTAEKLTLDKHMANLLSMLIDKLISLHTFRTSFWEISTAYNW